MYPFAGGVYETRRLTTRTGANNRMSNIAPVRKSGAVDGIGASLTSLSASANDACNSDAVSTGMLVGCAAGPEEVVVVAPDPPVVVTVGPVLAVGAGVAPALMTTTLPGEVLWCPPEPLGLVYAVVIVGFGHVCGVIAGGFGAPAIFCSWMKTSWTRFGGNGEYPSNGASR
jgi:hypothetical protein